MIRPIPPELLAARLLPLIDHPDPAVVAAAARAAEAAGAPCVEVGLRHPHSLDALHRAVRSTSIPVGAGTVTHGSQVEAALAAGAAFLVSPGAGPALVAAVVRAGAPWLPAAATPTEVMALREAGASMVKVFPVASLGGPEFLRALAAVTPELRMVPTGGIGASDVEGYLSVAGVAAVGGTWMFPLAHGSATDWSVVEAEVRAALALTRPA